MKVTKQSLIDWAVDVDGKTVAWIRKEKDGLGYKLEYKAGSQTVSEFYFNFKEAKEAAKTL
jgi:hypothetical protein